MNVLSPWEIEGGWNEIGASSYSRRVFGKRRFLIARIEKAIPYEVSPKHYGVMHIAYDVWLAQKPNGVSTNAKYFADSPEQMRATIDKKLIELGYRLLTKEEVEGLMVLL